jgi:hypothetical protein
MNNCCFFNQFQSEGLPSVAFNETHGWMQSEPAMAPMIRLEPHDKERRTTDWNGCVKSHFRAAVRICCTYSMGLVLSGLESIVLRVPLSKGREQQQRLVQYNL